MAKSRKKKRLLKTKAKKVTPKKPRFTPKVKKAISKAAPRKPPKGYELIPTETSESVQEAGSRIRAAFEDARTRLSYETSAPIVHEYKHEVDGEWRLDGIRGEKSSEIISEMLEALLPMPGVSTKAVLGHNYWLTVGLRWQGKGSFDKKTGEWSDEDEDHYRKHEGMLEVSSNYRQMINRGRILSAFNTVLEGSSRNPTPMYKAVEKKYRRKIAQVFIRINWNPDNIQPKRQKYEPK